MSIIGMTQGSKADPNTQDIWIFLPWTPTTFQTKTLTVPFPQKYSWHVPVAVLTTSIYTNAMGATRDHVCTHGFPPF
jgi:hypothetical protein